MLNFSSQMLFYNILIIKIGLLESLRHEYNWPFRQKREYGEKQNRRMATRYKNTLLDGLDAEKKTIRDAREHRFIWSEDPLFKHKTGTLFESQPKSHPRSKKFKLDIPPFMIPPFCVSNSDTLELIKCKTRNEIGPGSISSSHFDKWWREQHLTANDQVYDRETFFKDIKKCAFKVNNRGDILKNKERREYVPISNSMRFCLYTKLSNGKKIPGSYNNETTHAKFHVIEMKGDEEDEEMLEMNKDVD